MNLPEQLLLSDLLRRRVRCDQGLDHGPGTTAWMHPPVHRVLGWVSRPANVGAKRQVWRLDQLRGLIDLEVLVKGDPAETEQSIIEQLPTLLQATLLGREGTALGTLVDAAVDTSTGVIRHYLVSRSDPRLPGSSRWRLTPDRIEDQRPGEVLTRLQDLDDLPLAKASVRQEFLRRSRRWRDQVQDLGDRFEQRVEGWLEEPPWEPEPSQPSRQPPLATEPWDADDDWSPDYDGRISPLPKRRPRQGAYKSDLQGDADPWF